MSLRYCRSRFSVVFETAQFVDIWQLPIARSAAVPKPLERSAVAPERLARLHRVVPIQGSESIAIGQPHETSRAVGNRTVWLAVGHVRLKSRDGERYSHRAGLLSVLSRSFTRNNTSENIPAHILSCLRDARAATAHG